MQYKAMLRVAVIFLPANPASFTHSFVSGMQSFYFSESQYAMILQACHKNGVLDSLIWKTASPRTHKPKIVNKSLELYLLVGRFDRSPAWKS